MLGRRTGIVRQINCQVCSINIEQYQMILQGKGKPSERVFWVSSAHNAPCGLPCFTSIGALVGEVHGENMCPRCGAAAKSSRAARPRVRSTVTASAILGQLTVNELRVAIYLFRTPVDTIHHLASIRSGTLMPDASVRDTLRRLAARGVVAQTPKKHWRINTLASVTDAEVFYRDRG